MQSGAAIERPLSGASKLGLIVGAGAITLVFYGFALISVVLLLALIGVELLLAVALARFGLISIVAGALKAHLALLCLFFRSLWLRKSVEFSIELNAADAPGLFDIVERLSGRLGIARPKTVSLEMNANAWVRLKGYRRGAGTTILGVGYDLLAGLSAGQVEAVLAHEMVHAKFIQRGFKRCLAEGLGRSVRLSTALATQVQACQRAKQPCHFADTFLRGADSLTRIGAWLVATYSRQDEFAADAGAAKLCGAAPIRSALIKIQSLGNFAARLPWRERVARLQSREGYGRWLVSELTKGTSTDSAAVEEGVFNKYSTHPLLRDRLAALPAASDGLDPDTGPGLQLLAEPDALAEDLVAEIQRIVAEEEQKDSRRLQRWSRKTRRTSHLRPLQTLGVVLGLAGIIFLAGCLAVGGALILPVVGSAAVALGIVLHRAGRYRDRLALPVPAFSLLKEGWKSKRAVKELQAAEKELEQELRASSGPEKKKGPRAFRLASEGYRALACCDYLRAHVAARLCLEMDGKSVEGSLALSIAAAGLGMGRQSSVALSNVQKATGLAGQSTIWGVAWALVLGGNWAEAEAFLEQAHQDRLCDSTILTLLALCQSRRGKLQSAISSARAACTLAPEDVDHARVLIDLLLEAGCLREAQERLVELETPARTDSDLAMAMVRLNLLLRNPAAADEWAQVLLQGTGGPHALVRLGQTYEMSRKDDSAAASYHAALVADHYPEAHLGLARLAAGRRNKAEAQRHLLDALNLERPTGKDGVGPLPLFHDIVGQLLSLRDPVPQCQAWIATLNRSTAPPALANASFMVYAAGQQEAEQHIHSILGAMQPGKPPLLPGTISWRPAPKQLQPAGPVRPGIQSVTE